MTSQHDYPQFADQRQQREPVAHWLDRSWVYNPASSHADSSDFRRRQQERMLQAQRQRQAA